MAIGDKSLIQKTISYAKAVLTGKDVSQETLKKRLAICAECDWVTVSAHNLMRCGICKCKLKTTGLQNLARYEETSGYGCKHPDGSQWKAGGV
tara:strand:- start:165 stop:443 length:279 start_codon:yes stop_codon:yes gene_type:complete